MATEMSKASVAAAEFNLEANDVSNASIARLSAEDFTAAWHGKKESKRAAGLNLKEHDLKTILVDPPRAGVQTLTEVPQAQTHWHAMTMLWHRGSLQARGPPWHVHGHLHTL